MLELLLRYLSSGLSKRHLIIRGQVAMMYAQNSEDKPEDDVCLHDTHALSCRYRINLTKSLDWSPDQPCRASLILVSLLPYFMRI